METILEMIMNLWAALLNHLKDVLPEGVYDVLGQIPMPITDEEV